MDDAPARSLSVPRRGPGLFLRALGVATIVAGLTFGGAFAYVAGTVGLVVGAGASALGLAVGALLLRSSSARRRAADDAARAERELAMIALAERSGGVLRATDVSRAFRVSAAEADAMLGSIADGSRVGVEITSDGIVEYVFRELAPAGAARVRVELGDGAGVAPESLEDVAVARSANDRPAARRDTP